MKIFTAFILLLCLAVPGYGADSTEQELRELQAVIHKLKRELQQVKGEKGQLEKQLEKNETDIGKTLQRIEALKRKLEDQQSRLESLQGERLALQRTRRQQQKLIADEIQAAYKLGRQSNLKLLLNNQNPADLSRQLRYHDYFLAARGEQIDAYLDTLSQLDRVEPAIRENQQQLKKNHQELESRYSRLRHSQSERRQTLARLKRIISDKDSELRQQQQNRRRLEQLLEDVSHALADLHIDGDTPFSTLRGKLNWPVQGRVQHRFGSARIAGKIRWDGMLIKARAGTEVKAIHHGRVVFADYLRGYGLLVIIDHGENYLSLYGHNQSLLVNTGDWISAGQALATVGSSGGRSNSGLYFALRKNGQATNPGSWLKRA